jgi:hypothetical protein
MLSKIKVAFWGKYNSLLIFWGLFGILITRSLGSMSRFPADPGYDYVLSGSQNGIKSWFNLDPYVHFGAHFLSWIASFSPIEHQAIVLAVFVHLVWALTGLGICLVLKQEGFPQYVQLISAFSLVLCPAAAESSLANVGNVKWPLLILAIFIVSSNTILAKPTASGIYLFITGLTNPLSIIAVLPLAHNFMRLDKDQRKRIRFPVYSLLLTFLIQVLIVGLNGLSQGAGGAKIMSPWPGMGLFWLFGLISPSALCLISLIAIGVLRVRLVPPLIPRIALTAPALAIASYLYGGIGDRYFVAPMMISWVTVFATTDTISKCKSKVLRTSLVILPVFFLLVPIIKWFDSSWYLKAGTNWPTEVNRAKSECALGEDTVQLIVGEENIFVLPCSYILNN